MLVSSFPDKRNRARGIFNYRFIKQLKELSEDVYVVFFRMWTPKRKIVSSYFYDQIKVTQICLPLIPFNNYFSFKINNLICRVFGWQILKKELESSNIIHSVYLTNNGINAGIWARKLKIPHVAQAIGSDVNSDLKSIVQKKGDLKWINKIDGIISNSKDLEKSIKEYFPKFSEIETIYRGIKVDDLPTFTDLRNAGTTFLYLGGLEQNRSLQFGVNTKGGITLMEAWKKVESELFSLNTTLYFGGPGFDNKIIAKWKSSLKHPQMVHLIGKIDPDDVKKYLYKSNLSVVPSMEEGLPNFLMESYANGKAVIGSDAGGIPEVILNNETGYIFEKGNVEQLAECLLKAAKNTEVINIMSKKAHERVKFLFNSDTYSFKVLKFYKKILDKCAE